MQTVREVRRILHAEWRWFIVLTALWAAVLAAANCWSHHDDGDGNETTAGPNAGAGHRPAQLGHLAVGVLALEPVVVDPLPRHHAVLLRAEDSGRAERWSGGGSASRSC